MSRRIRIADRARNDLDDIWDYIAQRNLDAADAFLDKLQARFPMLARYPEAGRLRQELGPTLRSFPVGEFIIFYRPIPQGIEVARVLRGRRDIERIFRDEEAEGNIEKEDPEVP